MIDRTDLVMTGLIFALIGAPLILRKIPPNGFYGFRTARTLADETIWYKANWFAGWALVSAAVAITLIASVFPRGILDHRGAGAAVILVPVAIAVAASVTYINKI